MYILHQINSLSLKYTLLYIIDLKPAYQPYTQLITTTKKYA
jgi:hypothetical protein